MIGLLSLFLWISASQFVTIPILYSQYTPWWIVDYLKANLVCSTGTEAGCSFDSPFQYIVIEINDFSDFESFFENSDYIFVFDGTTSLSISSFINYYARIYGFIQFIDGNAPENPSEYVYYTDYSYSIYRKAALSIAKKYNIQKAVGIITSDFTGMDFTNDEGVEIVAQYFMMNSVSYEYIVSLLTKEIKPLGVKWFFFETSTHVAQMFQQALVEADMYKEGYTYIFMQEASWGAYLEGAITLEARWYHSDGVLGFINNIIYWTSVGIYEMITSNEAQGSYSPYVLDKFISQLFTYEAQGFTIWNVQSGGNLTAVVKINGDGINIYSPVMFPGGTYNPPNNDIVQIPFSINGAFSKDDGRNAMNQLGATYAIEMIKTKKLMLENFDIVANNISDCGSSDFIYNSSHECFESHISELGYFHISALETSVPLGIIEIFEALNLSTPVLGVETSTTMSNLKYYPQYIRVSYPNSHTASAASLILSIYGITKCSLLYSDSIWGRDFKSQFEKQTKSYNIEILNKNMAVPLGFDGSNNKIIQEVIKTKSRYVILELYQPDILYVIEAFYDLGMRKGDIYLIVGDGMISLSDLDEQRIGSDSYKKRGEIMSDLIYISFLPYQNQVGLAIENEFLSLYGFAYDYMCLFYDAAYLGIYAIDYLLNEGVNVNSSTIEKIIRDIKFTGCSGIVRISQGENDRLTTMLGIQNLIKVDSTWTMDLCGRYDPSQLIVLQMTKTISWITDGKIPNDIIGDGQECPFRSIDVQSFFYGYIILIIIEIIPFLFGIGALIRFYYYIFEPKLQKLISPEKENLYDILSYLLMIIESLQYMQLVPNLDFFAKWYNVTKLSFFDIRGWNKKDKFTFWNQVQLFEALSFLWIILLLWRKLRIIQKSRNFIIMTINEFNLYFLPLIGDALFLPICLILFQTYQCTNSIGDNFKDSFNNHACSTFCWQGEHINYVIISSIAICLYMPSSLYFRSTWKDGHPFHFQETVFHCVLKSFVQMSFISLCTIVSPASENAFLGLGIGLISVYIAISIFKRPFNYDRASLWYIIFLFCSLLIWVSYALAKFDEVLALILLGVGWTLTIAVGLLYQKLYLPSLLQSEKAQNIYKLFRFQLFAISPEDAGISKSAKYIYARNSSLNDEETNNRARFNFMANNIQSEDNMQSSKNFIDSSNLNLEGFNSSCSKYN